MCTCPICGNPAYGPVVHGTAKALQTPEFYAHVHHGRVYWHRMDWAESAPEAII